MYANMFMITEDAWKKCTQEEKLKAIDFIQGVIKETPDQPDIPALRDAPNYHRDRKAGFLINIDNIKKWSKDDKIVIERLVSC